MPIVFVCGAEAASEPGTTSHWTSLTGSVTKDATHVRSGGNALKFVTAGSASYVRKSITAGNRNAVMRFSVYATAAPASEQRLLEWQSGFRYLSIQTNGKLQLFDTESLAVLPLNQFVAIDIQLNTSANPHTYAWRVNGVAQTSTTNAIAAADLVNVFLGDTSGGATATWWIDDFALSLTAADYPIDDGAALWNGSAEQWVVTSTASFAQAAAAWDATAGYTAPSSGGHRVGGLSYVGRLPRHWRDRELEPIVEPEPVPEPEPEPEPVTASAAFAQSPAAWRSSMNVNDDELVLEMLAQL